MRCEDEKMFYRPPLLEEPCAQTLSGMKGRGEGKISKKGTEEKMKGRGEGKIHKVESGKSDAAIFFPKI